MEEIKIPLGKMPHRLTATNYPALENIAKYYLMARDDVYQKEAITICDQDEASYKVIVHWREGKDDRRQKLFYFINWLE